MRWLTLVAAAWIAGACDSAPSGPSPVETCGPYPDWSTSPYVLPYGVGTTHFVLQGNCSASGSHRGDARHAYDLVMSIGTPVLAVRGGVVVRLNDSHPNGTGMRVDDNLLQIRHDDGSFATYIHINPNSSRVRVGDVVMQSDWIASGGNSGATGGVPHLHFQVSSCEQRSVCGTLPVTFRNTDPNPEGLVLGQSYPARP